MKPSWRADVRQDVRQGDFAKLHTGNTLHGLWIGTHLSRLEKLTLLSFVRHGHEFNLWAYDELDEPLPAGVKLRDAATILPRSRIFLKADIDPSAGVGRKSYGPFSDLFRYKLLHDHGGIWVDMDVTCLKAFDFTEPYVFRAHRIGVMGNLMKAPKGSALMRQTFECADEVANETVSWLTLNKILCDFVHRLQLEPYIKKNIINDEELEDTIASYAGSLYKAPPPSWYGLHWGNEYWGTRTQNHAAKGGNLPTKNNPLPESFLHELYRSYGLFSPAETGQRPALRAAGQLVTAGAGGNVRVTARRPAPAAAPNRRRSINMLVATLSRGGAERIVIDIGTILASDPNIDVYIYVKSTTKTKHEVKSLDNLFVVFLNMPGVPSLTKLAQAMTERGNPVIYTHLIRRHDLETLWRAGIATIPVVHNARQGWNESPSLYDHENVPFVIACADTVKAEIEAEGCPASVLTIRHEVSLSPNTQDMIASRRKIRSQWGVGDDVLMIGMVGQFKSQKAYTRAVRVLAKVLQIMPAKLMIVGGWDHKYGAGRITFEATMRLAVDLGVVADMILIGEAEHPMPYLAAFDVFLSTSIFEGLSISVMEAIACGCPLVLSAVGGVAEIAPPDAVLIHDSSDIDAYCAGILKVAARQVRTLPPRKPEAELVANIWLGLSQVAARLRGASYPAANGTLFILDGLHTGGPAVSLTRLLAATTRRSRVGLALLHGISLQVLAEVIDRAEVTLFQMNAGITISRSANWILDLLIENRYAAICFWSAPPELKLLLAKLLGPSPIKLIDVSPGPMLFDEIDQAADFQKRIAFTSSQYFSRLDHFAALYKAGLPDAARGSPKRSSVIPLGVPEPPRFIPLPPSHLLPSEQIDPELAIGTVTRIISYKRIEVLIDAMEILGAEIPGASLTIVGGPDPTSTAYAAALQDKVQQAGLRHVFFAGPYGDVNRFLALWKVFVLAGERQGCPNASLEAMAMGLPVIAFESGGLHEQITNGVNGYLVQTAEEMAAKLKLLLLKPPRRQKMGERARAKVAKHFSLQKSAAAFAQILDI